MQIKRYEAIDMSQAIKLVKEDLGSEAVILSSRKITKGAGKFGMFGRQVIEVTAAAETPVIVENPRQRRYRPRESGSENKSHAQKARSKAESAQQVMVMMEPVLEGLDEIRNRLSEFQPGDDKTGPVSAGFTDDVRELKSMMAYLVDQAVAQKGEGDHKNYQFLVKRLTEQGVAPEYARAIVDEIKETGGSSATPDLRTLVYVAVARMRDTVTMDGWIDPANTGDEQRVVALTGPTGVGKTTTVAKLASNLSMNGVSVGLITIDTFRIAAVEQLKIYARILDAPLEVALSPAELKNCLHSLRDMDVVLIDTAGRSHRDKEHMNDLEKYLDAAPEIETRLTLSATASDRQLEETIRNFSRVRVDGLIFTKLDEAVRLGPIFNQQVRTGLPISYFTTGQSVPEDIEEASVKRLIGGMFKQDKANK